MIKQLIIKNFQSHKYTELEFDPGVNIIVGESDSGKSAILRALRWAVWNRPSGDGMRSWWGGETVVHLETDTDSVDRWKHNYENAYRLNTQTHFEAFKTDVPEEIINALNLSEINLQRQLDAPFLLSKTPGEVAQHFNKVARLDKIDTGLQKINSSIRDLSGTIKYKEGEEKLLIIQLEKFDHLEKFEVEVEVLEGMEIKLTRLQRAQRDLIARVDRIKEIQTNITQEQKILKDEELVNNTLENIYRRDAFEEMIIDIEERLSRISEIKKKIRKEQSIIEDEELVNKLLDLYKKKEKYESTLYNLSKAVQRINNIRVLTDRENKKLTALQDRFDEEFPSVCVLCEQVVEKWKPIKGYEGLYEVSTLGRIKTYYGKNKKEVKSTAQIKEQEVDFDGYKRITLYASDRGLKYVRRGVHQIVLETFVGPCPEGMEASHLDNDPSNNRLNNLVWETHLDNEHRKKREPCVYHICTKLTEKEVEEIKLSWSRRNVRPRTYTELAELYDTTDTIVSKIVNNSSWHGKDFVN